MSTIGVIGIRESTHQTTEILRTVREQQTEYIITYRGQPVAMILPLTETWRQIIDLQSAAIITPSTDLWVELDELRKEVAGRDAARTRPVGGETGKGARLL